MDSQRQPIAEHAFLEAISALDERIHSLGLRIWLGGEPTFTDRYSEAPEWLSLALGCDKEQRSERMLREFINAFPGAAVLRTLGRQYPGESAPRWSVGLYARRDGAAAWQGPPDPALISEACAPWEPDAFIQSLAQHARQRAWSHHAFSCAKAPLHRLLINFDGVQYTQDEATASLLERPSVHAGAIPDSGLKDPLAKDGYYLIGIDKASDKAGGWPLVELPQVAASEDFFALLALISEAALAIGLTGLRLTGFPPPSDQHVLWSSLTPDPAVIEANLAPAASLQEFLSVNRALFEAAQADQLSPFRLQYNGRQTDSGGGGQLTIGGPTAEDSPFFVEPQLLPRLVRYFNHHPSLSYWFATEYSGSGSQAPRCDEGLRERFPELSLTLAQIARHSAPDPEFLWSGLAPFLADSGGNSHRSEINIEKLWNPYLGERGMLGLVELRPFRMAPSVETFTALAALVRALVARLMRHPYDSPLLDWGEKLHQRFALPYYLRQDLQTVFNDLAANGLGLGDTLETILLDDSAWRLGRIDWKEIRIEIAQAQEFWPLIGNRMSKQPSDSRLVDASTTRQQLYLESVDSTLLSEIELRVNGYRVPLRTPAGHDSSRLMGIRYRSFAPWQGLHPALPAQDRIEMTLAHPPSGEALQIELFEWDPHGKPYAGLPQDRNEAARRRQQRLVSRIVDLQSLAPAAAAPEQAQSDYCFDLRWL